MPFLVAALGRVLVWSLATWVGRLIIGLGIGVVAYSGLSVLLDQLRALIAQALATVDTQFLTPLSYFGFSQAIEIIFSAYVARFGTQTAYRIALRRATAP